MGVTDVSKMTENWILVRWGVNIEIVAIYGILKYRWLYQFYLNPWETFYNNLAYFYIYFYIFLYLSTIKVRRCCDVGYCPRKERGNPPKWLPFPVLDKENEGHYKKFLNVYNDSAPCEDHIPSKLTDICRVSEEQQVLRNIIQFSYERASLPSCC